MAKCLVTGGSGFIGSNLCERLLQDKNNYVICVDNFYSSSKENILNIHNRVPSVITVYYANGESAKIKADVLYSWFTSHGAIKEEVILLNGLKGRQIKIEVNKKEEQK